MPSRRLAPRLLLLWIAIVLVAGVMATTGAAGDFAARERVATERQAGHRALEPSFAAGPSTTIAAPATTATKAPTTTTTVAPTTTAPATPAPPVTTPPAPAATPTTTAPSPPATVPVVGPVVEATAEYAMSLLRGVIPPAWLAALPVTVEVIAGQTSWSNWGGLLQIGDWHLTDSVDRARFVLAHEWGHQVAWHYGTDEYNGAPPAGFPYGGPNPAEMWADCVATALTGLAQQSHGLDGCPADAVSFTAAFFAAGPGPKLR